MATRNTENGALSSPILSTDPVDNFVDCLGQINFFPAYKGPATALAKNYPSIQKGYKKQSIEDDIEHLILSNMAVMLSFTGSMCISPHGGCHENP